MFFDNKNTQVMKKILLFLYAAIPDGFGFLLGLVATGSFTPEEAERLFRKEHDKTDGDIMEIDLVTRAEWLLQVKKRLQDRGFEQVASPDQILRVDAFIQLIMPSHITAE